MITLENEEKFLGQCEIALINARKQPRVAEVLAEYTYDDAGLAVGDNLLHIAKTEWEKNKVEDKETSEAFANFDTRLDTYTKKYRVHRKKAKAVMQRKPEIRERLEIDGTIPRTFDNFMNSTRAFYTEILNNPEIQMRLAKVRVTPEDADRALNSIGPIIQARADYLREKGESENQTKAKNKALNELDEWMDEFTSIAKIALEEEKDLLEGFGMLIRN